MFCVKCGKEIKDNWIRCPYCGEFLSVKDKQESDVNSNLEIDMSISPKKKKKLPFIIGGIIGAVLLILVLLVIIGSTSDNENTDGDKKEEASEKVVELSTYEGGYAGWEAAGFPESVRTDITIPYPLQNTEYNNYMVYIGAGKINTGVIMQKDETPMSEWDWLMEAVPDEDTQAYYFNCTLTYSGQDVGENQTPLFVISDVESYFSENTTELYDEESSSTEEPEVQEEEDHSAEFVGEWYDTYSQRCDMNIDFDGEYYYIDINWGSSAWDNKHWSFVGIYDSETGGIIYYGTCVNEQFTDDGAKTETLVYTDGEGIVYLGEDGMLYWEDYKENAGVDCSFERIE